LEENTRLIEQNNLHLSQCQSQIEELTRKSQSEQAKYRQAVQNAEKHRSQLAEYQKAVQATHIRDVEYYKKEMNEAKSSLSKCKIALMKSAPVPIPVAGTKSR